MKAAFVGLLAFALFLDPWNSSIVAGLPFGVLIRVVTILAALPLIFSSLPKLKNHFWVIFFSSLMLIWILVSSFNHPAIPEAIRSIRYYSVGILTFISIVMIGLSRAELKLVVWSQVVGCIWAIYLMQKGAIALEPGARAAVDGINGNYTAYCCVHAASLMVILWRKRFYEIGVDKKYSILNAMVLVVLLYGTILPSTRGAFLGMCLIIGMTIIGFPLRKSRHKFAILLISVAIVIVILQNSPALIARIRGEDSQDYGSYRPILWAMAWVLFKGSPLAGIGPGQYAPAAFGMPVHNVFLAVLTELGLVGLSIYLGYLIVAFSRAKKIYGQYNSWIFWGPWLLIALTGAWESAYTAFASFGLLSSEKRTSHNPDSLS